MMVARVRWCLVSLLFLNAMSRPLSAADGDWPSWRGPAGNGHTTEQKIPVEWSAKNVVWQVDLPGDGQSSPAIAGDRIFLTSSLDKGRERLVFCVDRRDGKLLWKESVWKGEAEPTHAMNGWASATCATNGEQVIAFFGKGGIHCFDVDGKKRWSKNLGPFDGPWGTGASPLIIDNLVIQNCEAEDKATITAFDIKSGDVVWSTPRDIPERGGWSSPVPVMAGGRREVVLNGFNGVTSYDPASGKKLWFCKSFAGRGEPTACPGDGMVFMINGLAGDVYAVKPGGEGDVTSSRMAWHTPRKAGRDQPSPIVVGDVMIVVSMDGVGCGYDVKTGRELWKDRLGGKYTSSPIAANGLIYFQSDAGETAVIKPGPKLDVIARNQIPIATDEIVRASLSPSKGQLFSRSNKRLYCIATK